MAGSDRSDNVRGFTLMEVLAAMLIAIFVILSVTNLFVVATHRVSAGREDTVGALYAQQKLEELTHLGDDAQELNGGAYADMPDSNYLRQWWVHKSNPAPGSMLIVVKVQPKYKVTTKPVVFAVVRP